MNTLTNKEKLALQVSLALVAGMFSLNPVVQGAPVLEKVVTGGATVHQSTANVTAVVPDSTATGVTNNVINWKDFSVGSGEKVIFDAADAQGSSYTKTNNYLNVVTGNGTSYVNGAMKGGDHVYLVNPNGVIMGKSADIDVGNLYVSTKSVDPNNFVGADLSKGASVLANSGNPQAEVVNMGKIQANSVYAEGTEIRFLNTADLKYKDVSDTTDIDIKNNIAAFNKLPILSNKSNTATNSGVTLHGTNYVHVGYEATAESQTANSGSNGQYATANIVTTNTATNLGYSITSSTSDHDYALVRNGVELQNMNSNKSLNYMLADNITLSTSNNFESIGDGTAPFTGNFDGNFFTVTNLHGDVVNGQTYAGLFGKVQGTASNHSKIMNVGVVDAALRAKAGGYAGGVVAYADYVDLENVYNKKTSTSANTISQAIADQAYDSSGSSLKTYFKYTAEVGGVVGHASNSTIKNVYNTGNILNGAGIVGNLQNSTLTNAYNAGRVENSFDYTSTFSSGTKTLEQHYAIADKISGSTVKNVYGSGDYVATDATGAVDQNESTNALLLAPSTTNFTNAYIIDTSQTIPQIDTVINDTSSANYKNNVSGGDANVASAYGFFGNKLDPNAATTTYIASTTATDDWRIYDGHSLPLLRSFLRANGNGTIPVSYDLSLYKTASGGTAAATISGYDSNEVVYNGYFVGASNVTSDSSRNLGSNPDIAANDTARIKNAGQSATLFYSTSQDGYDIADSTIKITERNLVPPYNMTISKVYDGTADATNEMRNAFSASSSAIDVADYYNKYGKLIETGLVQTYDGTKMTAENVTLSNTAVNSANYYKNGVDITNASNRTSANEAINVSDANSSNKAQVHVTWNTNAAIDKTSTTAQVDTDNDGKYDYANYKFDVTAFTNGTNTVSGIITERPVYVELQQSTGIDKVYDSTDTVVYKASGWSSATDNVQLVNNTTVAQGLNLPANGDYGLLASDSATMNVVNAYYTTGTGSGTVPNAGTGYTANYAVTFTSSKAGFDPSNYAFYGYTPASGTASASAAILNKDTNGNYLLTGTGNIDKRTVYTTNAELTYTNAGTTTPVNYHKTYDFTSDYTEANGVDFNTTGGTVSVTDAVNQLYTTGIISGDNITFSLLNGDDTSTTSVMETAPTFYTSDQPNAATANEVADAKYVGYWVKVGGNNASNYTFKTGTATNPGTAVTSAGNNMQFFHTGGIDQRELHLTLNQATGINKTYDGTTNLVDTTNRAYSSHTDNSSIGNVTYVSGSDRLIAADGSTWSISANYLKSGTEAAAKDVYKANGAVVNNGKNIEYDVSLTGTGYEDNYILYVGNTKYDQATANNPAKLTATGKIDPVTISKVVFGNVNKSYDGTTVVGKAATTTGSVQSGNYITITDVTNGNSTNAAANGTSVLVSGETLQDVFGTANTTALTGGGIQYTGNAITGVYGNTTAYIAGNTASFSSTNGEHAYATGTGTTGASRYVKYTGLSTALANDNYVIAAADDDQYGIGRIDPLTITSLSYGNNNVIGATEKVYDGTSALAGGNKVTYKTDGTVNTVTSLGNTTGTAAIGNLIGSNASLGVTGIPLSYTVNNNSYFADASGNATAEASGANKATQAFYSLTVTPGSNGDYVLGTPADTTYKNGNNGVAEISGSGTITPRHVFVDGVSQTKEYDGGTTISATGNNVVTMSAQKGQTAVTGLVGNPVNNSKAVYSADAGSGYRVQDANVYFDYDATTNPTAVFRSLTDKTVTFTPTLASGNGNYEFYHNGSKVNSTFATTGHAIKQKDLTVTFNPIAKTYDGNDYVITNGSNTVTLTTGTGDPVYTPLAGDVVTITTQNTSQFLPLANSTAANSSTYAGSHDVRYDLEVSGANYRNYRLVDGSNKAYTMSTNASGGVITTGSGTGTINTASANTANATFGNITKVYDGNTSVTYDHTNSDYETSQSLKANSASFVTGLTLGQYNMTGKYSVLDALTHYNNGADVGNHSVTYTFQITDQAFLNNVTLSLPSQYNYNSTNHTFTYDTTGSITEKNVYASLTGLASSAEPTKVYNGKTDVVDNTQANPTGTAWTSSKLGNYMTVTGLVKNGTVNDTATISAKYTNADVAGTSGSVVEYKAAITNPTNYKLYTKDAAGQVVDANGNVTTATNDTLKGTGTITPKELTFLAGYTEKQYDANSLVAGTTVTTAPTYSFGGLVNGEMLTPDSTAITGTYVISDGKGGYTPDPHVGEVAADGVTQTSQYRAVQYEGLNNAFANATGSNGGKISNYVLTGAAVEASANTAGASATYFNASANNGTAVYGANLANGQITQRYITSITPTFKDITREYNSTAYVGATANDPTAKQYFELQGMATGMTSPVPVDYDLNNAFFADPVAGYDGTTVTGYVTGTAGLHKDVQKDGFLAVYQIGNLSTNALRDFTLGPGLSSSSYAGEYVSKMGTGIAGATVNEITPRVISGSFINTGSNVKIYDGYDTAPNVSSYFTLDADDAQFMVNDGVLSSTSELNDLVKVTGQYASKDANISPTAALTGLNKIKYTLSYDNNVLSRYNLKNYTLQNGTSGNTYIGDGDIRQRIVYVQDKDSTLQEKTYDGTDTGTVASGKFSLKGKVGDTGVIAGDNVDLDTDAIKGTYVDKNVARTASGDVTTKAVNYTNFVLKDTDTSDNVDNTGNYYLEEDSSIKSVTLNDHGKTVNSNVSYAYDNGKLVITEADGGRINPKKVTIGINSPHKVYDAELDVEAADAAATNLTDANNAPIAGTYHSVNNNLTFAVDPGTGTAEDITVTIKGGAYNDKNANLDKDGNLIKPYKITAFDVTWDNDNYDLAGQYTGDTQDAVAGQSEDTFDITGYSKNNGKVTREGTLKDYQGTISPLALTIASMKGWKTYDAGTGYSYGTDGTPGSNELEVSFGAADAVIQKDIDMSQDSNINNNKTLLGLTVGNGEYKGATDAALAKAGEADSGISQKDIDSTRAKDAAFNASSDSFEHTLDFSEISVSNPNYTMADGNDGFTGTGVINRATVTATPNPLSATIRAGETMPDYTGTLSGFAEDETDTIPVTKVTYEYDDDGNVKNTIKEIVNVPIADYYAGKFTWGPESGITNLSEGTNPIYGWYRKTEMVDGKSVETFYKDGNLSKNYVLAQNPGELVIEKAPSGSSGGGSTTTPKTPLVTVPKSASSTVSTPTPTPASTPVQVVTVDMGYVEKPVVPDSNVYQNVSKDVSQTNNYEASAAIQYGDTGTGIVSDSNDGNSSGTIAIELADVVNLLGGDVASDGVMSLTNTDSGSKLSVESTESGYLSVGNTSSEGSIGIETEGGILSTENSNKEGTIGLETEEGNLSVETEEKMGSIGLETEDGTLLDSTKETELTSGAIEEDKSGTDREGSISIKSSSKEGEAEITAGVDKLTSDDSMQKTDKDKDNEDDEEEDAEESESKEGEAAITYGDVA